MALFPTISLVIFDFDGTLADTTRGIVDTFQATMERMGRPKVAEERIRAVIGLHLKENFTKGADMTPEDADRAVEIYREIFFRIAPQTITAFPGVLDTLSALHSRGIRMAIASSRKSDSLSMLMDRLGISRYIPVEYAFGADCVENAKPAPDLVYEVCRKMDANPEDCLVVGDTVFDIEMGRRAHCRTCAVSYGNQSADLLAGASPDCIIDDIRKLL